MPNYLALTIGPIGKTIDKARSTRALWGASFVFSYLMRTICKSLKNKAFVVPLVSDARMFTPHGGAGLFPDRLIFIKETEQDLTDLYNAVNNALDVLCTDQVANAISEQIRLENLQYHKSIPKQVTSIDLKEYFGSYLLLAAVEKEANAASNVLDLCNHALSLQEQWQPLPPDETVDYFYYFLQAVQQTHLPEVAFGKETPKEKRRFPSLIEIATAEFGKEDSATKSEYDAIVQKSLEETRKSFGDKLANKPKKQKDNDEEDNLIKDLKRIEGIGKIFRRRHKYIAIVKADGDNLGKTVERIYERFPDRINEVDQMLLEFNLKAIETIHAKGGRAVYLGGDDVLFFAPVKYGNDTVFDTVQTLNTAYNEQIAQLFSQFGEKFNESNSKEKRAFVPPTLSFGVSISYYKYPIFEALHQAEHQLDKAKDMEKGKNSVAFNLLKHSGSQFGSRIPKKAAVYDNYFLASA